MSKIHGSMTKVEADFIAQRLLRYVRGPADGWNMTLYLTGEPVEWTIVEQYDKGIRAVGTGNTLWAAIQALHESVFACIRFQDEDGRVFSRQEVAYKEHPDYTGWVTKASVTFGRSPQDWHKLAAVVDA